MQDNSSQNFDIFDLFFIIKKHLYKYLFFSFLYALLVFTIYFFANNSKKELRIQIFIENDLFLPSKYNALSNFLMLSNNKIVMSNLKTNLDKLEYNYYFLTRHINGISSGIFNNAEHLSSEYKSFFYSSYIESYQPNISTLNIIYDGNQIEYIDKTFLNKLINEINSRLNLSLLELMERINEEIKNLDKLLYKDINNNKNFLENIYKQNLNTIQDFKKSNIENYFVLKEIEIIKFKSLSIRYYLSAILLYFFLISFSSILFMGYEIKKRKLK